MHVLPLIKRACWIGLGRKIHDHAQNGFHQDRMGRSRAIDTAVAACLRGLMRWSNALASRHGECRWVARVNYLGLRHSHEALVPKNHNHRAARGQHHSIWGRMAQRVG